MRSIAAPVSWGRSAVKVMRPSSLSAVARARTATGRSLVVAQMAAADGDDKGGGGYDSGGSMWGGRFEEKVTSTVEKFGESVSYDSRLYKQDIEVGSHATSWRECDVPIARCMCTS
eukprot:scaffold7207_cov520-Prasinococcus_capsulatus_cf.AAC.21